MMRVGELITTAARYHPDRLASVYKEISLTYKELNERVNTVGNAILGAGLGHEDRVGVICHNSHFFQEIFFGTAKTGAVCTTINWRLKPRELEFIINDAEVKILFVANRFWTQIEPIKDKLPGVQKYVMIGDSVPGTIRYEDFLKDGSADEIWVDLDPHDTFWHLYTSGTTGRPKGVLLTHRNLYADCEHNIIGNELNRDGSVWLNVLPMFHIALKLIIMCAYTRSCVVFLEKFDLKEVCEAIEGEGVTHVALAPTMWQMFIEYADLEKYRLNSLKYAFYSTSPMPPVLIRRLMKKFPEIRFYSTYGLTEAGSSLTILPFDQHVLDGPDHMVRRLGSLGRPMIGVDVRIVDEKEQDCPPGKIGEIIGRGDNIMKGYWRLPEETKETLREGWLHTGDMGYWDEHGYIYMADRKKEMIISGGENVYPKEVEMVIREMEGIEDVAVIGVPDEIWGEAVKAVVIKSPGSGLTEGEIMAYCALNIAGYKRPKSIDFVSDLPRSQVGKILKTVIREKYWRGTDRKV